MNPEQLEALWRQGQQQEAQHQSDAARATYAQILAGSPRQVMVQLRISELEQRAGRYREARGHALQAADTIAAAGRWEALAFATANLLVFDERVLVRELIHQSPWGDPRIIRQSPVLSQHLSLCGDEAGTLRLLDAAAPRVRPDPRMAYSRAIALQHLGRIVEATAAFENCLKLAPDFALAHWSLAYHAASKPPGARVARIRAALTRTQTPSERAMLHYALYKELDSADQRDAAWSELEAGATLMRGMLGYSPQAFDTGVQALLADDTPAATSSSFAAPGRTPIFIVGMPRTGTTLLSRILGAHPAVADADELNALENAISECLDRFVDLPLAPSDLEALRGVDAQGLGAAYMRRTQPYYGKGCTHLIDKNPMNLFAASAIVRAMPNAKLLCLVRNGMDTCYSNLRQLFQNGAFPYSYDQRALAERYAAFRRVVDCMQVRHPENFLAVSYEALAQDPVATAGRVMEFCGLRFDPAYVDITRNATRSATASASQVRQPIHLQGIGEWRRYEAQLAPLAERLSELGFPA